MIVWLTGGGVDDDDATDDEKAPPITRVPEDMGGAVVAVVAAPVVLVVLIVARVGGLAEEADGVARKSECPRSAILPSASRLRRMLTSLRLLSLDRNRASSISL